MSGHARTHATTGRRRAYQPARPADRPAIRGVLVAAIRRVLVAPSEDSGCPIRGSAAIGGVWLPIRGFWSDRSDDSGCLDLAPWHADSAPPERCARLGTCPRRRCCAALDGRADRDRRVARAACLAARRRVGALRWAGWALIPPALLMTGSVRPGRRVAERGHVVGGQPGVQPGDLGRPRGGRRGVVMIGGATRAAPPARARRRSTPRRQGQARASSVRAAEAPAPGRRRHGRDRGDPAPPRHRLSRAVHEVRERTHPGDPGVRLPPLWAGARLVLIDGRAGAGKTRLAAALATGSRLDDAPAGADHGTDDHHRGRLAMDDLYAGWDGLPGVGRELHEQLVRPLVDGVRPRSVTWDWHRDRRAAARALPAADVLAGRRGRVVVDDRWPGGSACWCGSRHRPRSGGNARWPATATGSRRTGTPGRPTRSGCTSARAPGRTRTSSSTPAESDAAERSRRAVSGSGSARLCARPARSRNARTAADRPRAVGALDGHQLHGRAVAGVEHRPRCAAAEADLHRLGPGRGRGAGSR